MLFNPRTYPEIYGGMVARVISASPLTDVNFGSVLSTMLEAAAQEDDEQYFQMLEIIRGYSLDTTTGTDLEDRAFEYGLTRKTAQVATTKVTLGDTAITKIETGVYSGLPGAPAGAMEVNGDGSTGFSVTGSIIVGRGTPNAETVSYSSITSFGNYVRFNLSSALAFDHGTDESIILSQGGNRLVVAGTVVKVPASDINPQIDFALDANATILDGESEVTDVAVTASEAGGKANVPVGSISQYDSPPFSTAIVSNPRRVTNGRDVETDQELRDRIKDTIQSLSRGTGKSITTGVTGVLSETENKRVVSASLIEPTIPADVVKLYIDDGTGFVPAFLNIGFEEIVPSATGGEKFLKTNNFPLVKAFIETQNTELYNLVGAETLFVEVGGKTETITFVSTDFEVPGSAKAQEILKKINAVAISFEARLSSGGSKVRIFARSNSDEQIRVAGGTANVALGFPIDTKYTAQLYRERENQILLLSKDGLTAAIESGLAAGYDMSLGAENLCIVVDNKIRNPQNAWFRPADFVNPTSATALEISTKIQAQISGLTSERSSGNTKVTLISNIKRDSASTLKIVENFTKAFKFNGAFTDISSDVILNGSNTQLFAADGDIAYFGHDAVPFETVAWKFTTPASAAMGFSTEYWNGTTWVAFGVYDPTLGLTQDGIWEFKCGSDWAQNTVNGSTAYWVRVTRVQPVLVTAPTERSVKICSANAIFGFSETAQVGAKKDYTLNRYLGQIELEEPLNPFDRLTLGSANTRAFLVSNQGAFGLNGGETLTVEVDGIAQTITFQVGDFFTPGAALPSEVAARLNLDLLGTFAEVVDSGTRVKLRTNKQTGSLQVTGGTANTFLQYTTDLVSSLVSHIPSSESLAGPFTFPASAQLIVIVDKNLANNFTAPMFSAHTSGAGTNATTIVDATLQPKFPLASDLVDYDVLFTAGPEAGNRRKVLSYVPATGTITLATAFGSAPGVGNAFQVLPSDVATVVRHLNNKQITLLSTKASVERSSGGTKVQISSLNLGELASIQVSGGTANAQLGFSTAEVLGVDAYRHYTGLAQLVQWTVDGREDDQEVYPGIRAAGVQVEVADPVTIPIRVEMDITTREGVTLASITNDVKSAVSSYINTLPVGADVIISSIIRDVKGVQGVFDVKVNVPSANVAIADSELAKVNEANIIIG